MPLIDDNHDNLLHAPPAKKVRSSTSLMLTSILTSKPRQSNSENVKINVEKVIF